MTPPTPAPAPADGGSMWQRLKERLTSDDQSIDARRLQDSAVRQGATSCCDLAADLIHTGDAVKVSGRLRSVVYTPGESGNALTAELFDGSGAVQLVWLGRRRIPGIEPGRSLIARGRLARRDGMPTVFNPWYELIAE